MPDGDDFFADDVLPEVPQAEEVLEPEGQLVGQGEIPPDLARFNVSAFVWGAWWNLAYGLWLRLAVQFALIIVTTVTLTVLNTLYGGGPRTLLELAPQVALGLLAVGVNAWFALSANVRVWQNAMRRSSGASVITLAKSARGSADAFRKTQKTWTLLGLAFWAFVVVQPLLAHVSSAVTLRTAGSLVQGAITLAAAVIAWLLLYRQSA